MEADGIPIRITGQLFYDGSHPNKTCPAQAKQQAQGRASSWELHPVYSIDVCRFTTLATCDPRNDPRWQSLEDWRAENADEDHGDEE